MDATTNGRHDMNINEAQAFRQKMKSSGDPALAKLAGTLDHSELYRLVEIVRAFDSKADFLAAA